MSTSEETRIAADRVDPDLIEAFEREGFVHVPGLLNVEEVARYGAAVDHAVARRTRDDQRALSERTPFEQSFTMCQYLWEDFPEVGGLTFHPRIAGVAAALIGASRVRLWHDQALYKAAGGRETEMHQDHPYWPIAERDTITAWIALMAIDETTGCMGYIPGSHCGEVEFIDVFSTPGAGHAFEARQATAAKYVPCQPGDVIFHHGATIHAAKANLSQATRRVHSVIYFRDGCTRADDRVHFSLDRDAVAVGAKIDGAATPIAWPLTDGHLPKPIPFSDAPINGRSATWSKRGVFPAAEAQ